MNARTSLTIVEQHQYASSGLMRMSRSAAILGVDVIASLLAMAWMRWGVWLDLYGYSVYRNRSGRWVPRPATAIDYLGGIAYSATSLFVALFLLTSCACFLYVARARASSDGDASEHVLSNAFYGGSRTLQFKYSLFVRTLQFKYSLFVLSIGVSPGFYYYLWNLDASDTMRIVAGFAMTALTFMVPMLVASWWIARRAHHPQATVAQGR